MCSKERKISLGFSKLPFNAGLHICLIYRDEKERRSIISKFLASGYEADEKIGYFTDIMTPIELKKWFQEIGIEIPRDSQQKQIVISPAKEVYCPTGKFVHQEMLKRLSSYYDQSIKEGFCGARVTGDTTWLSERIPGVNDFMEYEACINQALAKHPVTVMCQYDVNQFDGGTLFDILSVHPFMVVHGQIVKNPSYLKPEEFLQEYHNR